jgi:hypothetical protein
MQPLPERMLLRGHCVAGHHDGVPMHFRVPQEGARSGPAARDSCPNGRRHAGWVSITQVGSTHSTRLSCLNTSHYHIDRDVTLAYGLGILETTQCNDV